LLRRVQIAGRRSPAAAPPDPVPPHAAPVVPRGGLRIPSPRISALLVVAFVGFGALLGSAGSNPVKLSASAAPALKVLVPSSGAGSTGGSSTASSEPPEAAAEPTPSSEGGGEDASSASTGTKSKQEQAAGKEAKESEAGSTTAKAAKLSDIKHVFLIVLSDQPYASDFGPESQAHYLASTLEGKGELLVHYDAIAHEQLPNGVALISGQGPTSQTAADCPTYSPFSSTGTGDEEQLDGEGCVYPSSVKTLPGQLEAKHLSWRAYIQGADEGGPGPGACAHPASEAADPTSAAGAYATYRNPFVYFESIAQSPDCQADDVGLGALKGDLAGAPAKVPSLSYIAPDRCDDGGPTACSPGAPTGPGDADSFLQQVVPEIMASKAYKKDGLLVITTDEAPSSGELADSSSCCGQPAYPNYTAPELNHGGGAVGALLLSPLVKGATTSQEPYDHYSLLRTIEDVFGLGHIGYAALGSVKSFSASLLNGKG
jgi:phosphatidylinositol-3-phosphatase